MTPLKFTPVYFFDGPAEVRIIEDTVLVAIVGPYPQLLIPTFLGADFVSA